MPELRCLMERVLTERFGSVNAADAADDVIESFKITGVTAIQIDLTETAPTETAPTETAPPAPLDLAPKELRVTGIALRDYLAESKRYLSGVRPETDHDPCCDTDRGRREIFAEMERDLQDRVDTTRSALSKVSALLPDGVPGSPDGD